MHWNTSINVHGSIIAHCFGHINLNIYVAHYAYGTLCGLFASRFLSLFIASTFPFYQYKIISFLFVSFLQKYFMSLITSTATHCHCLGNSRRPQQQRCRCSALKCLANGWLADWCIKCIYLNLRNLKLFHSLKTLNEL